MHDYIDPWLALALALIATVTYLRLRVVQNESERRAS